MLLNFNFNKGFFGGGAYEMPSDYTDWQKKEWCGWETIYVGF